jgi:hypothetical protein
MAVLQAVGFFQSAGERAELCSVTRPLFGNGRRRAELLECARLSNLNVPFHIEGRIDESLREVRRAKARTGRPS